MHVPAARHAIPDEHVGRLVDEPHQSFGPYDRRRECLHEGQKTCPPDQPRERQGDAAEGMRVPVAMPMRRGNAHRGASLGVAHQFRQRLQYVGKFRRGGQRGAGVHGGHTMFHAASSIRRQPVGPVQIHVRGRRRLRRFEAVVPPTLLPARRVDHRELQRQREVRERAVGGEIPEQLVGFGGTVGFDQHDAARIRRHRLQRVEQLA